MHAWWFLIGFWIVWILCVFDDSCIPLKILDFFLNAVTCSSVWSFWDIVSIDTGKHFFPCKVNLVPLLRHGPCGNSVLSLVDYKVFPLQLMVTWTIFSPLSPLEIVYCFPVILSLAWSTFLSVMDRSVFKQVPSAILSVQLYPPVFCLTNSMYLGFPELQSMSTPLNETLSSVWVSLPSL